MKPKTAIVRWVLSKVPAKSKKTRKDVTVCKFWWT